MGFSPNTLHGGLYRGRSYGLLMGGLLGVETMAQILDLGCVDTTSHVSHVKSNDMVIMYDKILLQTASWFCTPIVCKEPQHKPYTSESPPLRTTLPPSTAENPTWRVKKPRKCTQNPYRT